MSQKRDHSDFEEGEVSDPEPNQAHEQLHQHEREQEQEHEPKRLKSTASHQRHQNAGIDATYGQKSVFSDIGNGSGTTIPIGQEDDFEDDTDAMAYLMSVRQEASKIPHLLRAPTRQIGPQLPNGSKVVTDSDNRPVAGHDGDGDGGDDEESGSTSVDHHVYQAAGGDSGGYYYDGAYIARASSVAEEDEEVEIEKGEYDTSPSALKNAYFRTLIDKYWSLRSILNAPLPDKAMSRLPRRTQTQVGRLTTGTTIATWVSVLKHTDPHPLQMALLSKESVIRLLRIILGGKFLRCGEPIAERTSRWLWALLARYPERGELDHTEVGWIRELGRRAVLMGRSLAEMAALRQELEDGGLGVHEGVDESDENEDMGEYEDTEVVSEFGKTASSDGHSGPQDDSSRQAAAPVINGQNQDTVPNQGAEQTEPQHATGQLDSEPEEGAISEDDEDIPMELASVTSSQNEEDNEASKAELAEAKARLLGHIDTIDTDEAVRQRERVNMRATVNMILTVAGEVYGQRDLLQFREPFVGM